MLEAVFTLLGVMSVGHVSYRIGNGEPCFGGWLLAYGQ